MTLTTTQQNAGSYLVAADHFFNAFSTMHCEAQVNPSASFVRDLLLHDVVECLYKELCTRSKIYDFSVYCDREFTKLHNALRFDQQLTIKVPEELSPAYDRCLTGLTGLGVLDLDTYVPYSSDEIMELLSYSDTLRNLIKQVG